VAVLVFPGTWSDRDFAHVAGLLGWEARMVWHTATDLGDADAVVLPGGFAHGDHLLFAAGLGDRHHTGLVQDNAAALHIEKRELAYLRRTGCFF